MNKIMMKYDVEKNVRLNLHLDNADLGKLVRELIQCNDFEIEHTDDSLFCLTIDAKDQK